MPRIKGIIEKFCSLFGAELEDGFFAFPSAETVAGLSLGDLAPLRSGYRAQYILSAARRVADGSLAFDELRNLPADEVRREVMQIHGVGAKVADCFMLYGLHIMDRFPVDVWMKRALSEHFPHDFDPAALGEYKGLAQQYIYYYTRSSHRG